MCLLREQVFWNKAMKLSRVKEHLSEIHHAKASKEPSSFQALKDK